MKKGIQSYSSYSDRVLKRLLVPNVSRVLLYFVISSLLLILLSGREIWAYFSGQFFARPNGLGNLSTEWLRRLAAASYINTILEVIFWIVVGGAVYMLFWVIKSIYLNVRNDFVADEFVHPQDYNRSKYWHIVLVRKLFFAGSFVTLLGYMFACFKLLPVLSRLSYLAINNFRPAHSLIELGLISLVSVLCLHLLAVLLHLVAKSWQFIYADL